MKRVPTSLDEAINTLYENLSPEAKSYIKFNGADGLHHGYGTSIRNDWRLWESSSPLHRYFNLEYELGHADDMSGMILNGLYHKVIGEPYDDYEDAKYYRDYWTKEGIDPLTLEKI